MTNTRFPRPQCMRGAMSVRLVGRGDPQRLVLDDYVRSMFRTHFDACPPRLFPWIAAVRDHADALIGALGLRWGSEPEFFCEAYLDEPVECAISRQYRRPIERGRILEFGHFAATQVGAGLAVAVAMAKLTKRWPVTWMVSTLNRPMRRSMGRAGIPLIELCEARSDKLGSEALAWGRYYESDPRVMTVAAATVCQALAGASKQADVNLDIGDHAVSAITG